MLGQATGVMTTGGMAYLVRHDTEQFPFACRGFDQPGKNGNQPGRGGKSVKFPVSDNKKMVVEGLGADNIENFPPQSPDVGVNIGFVNNLEFSAQQGEQALTQLLFFLDGQGLGRVEAAKSGTQENRKYQPG